MRPGQTAPTGATLFPLLMVGPEHVTEASRLLRLLQLTDSGFPTGAFAFSHGLEGLVSSGFITREGDVEQFISVQLREGFAGIECPAMAHAWRASRAGTFPPCWRSTPWLTP